MSAIEEIERQLLESVAARAQQTQHAASVVGEDVVRPAAAPRNQGSLRRRRLWSRGRLGVALAAVVLGGGVAAAAALLDQPSAPLAGRVPPGQQPGYAIAGGYRYRISLVPSLQVGQIGWCAAVTTTSKSGQLEDLGTGSCDDAPTSGAPLFAAQLGQGLSFVFAAPSVHAIQLPGHDRVRTISAGLPFGYRAAVFEYTAPPGGRLPRRASNEQFGIAALGTNGQQIPYDGSSMPNEQTLIWGHSQTPVRGSCSVTADPGARVTFGVGTVVTSIVPAPILVGGAFLPCLERDVRLDSSSPTSLPINKRVMQIYVLLNAGDPSAAAPALPYMRALAGHAGIFNNAELPLPDALSDGMTARRAGNAWLIVVGGRSTKQRLAVLSQIAIGHVNLHTSQTGGFQSHGCSLTYQPSAGFIETGAPFGATPSRSYRLQQICASTSFYYDSRWPLIASVARATARCPAEPLDPCTRATRSTRLQVSKVKGHAGERVVSIAGTERATIERLARGWLVVTGGRGAAQQQLLLSQLNGHIASTANIH
jgi:hypothetical protein